MKIGVLPRRCRLLIITKKLSLSASKAEKTTTPSASALFTFTLSLKETDFGNHHFGNIRLVFEINERNSRSHPKTP